MSIRILIQIQILTNRVVRISLARLQMRVLELLITCSSNPCIFSWLVFLFSSDFGAEEVICDDSGEEGDVLGVDGLSRSSFLSIALAGIAFLH